MEQLLVKLGLSDKEAKVYTALLELAEDTVQNIAKKSGVNRATTYVILDKLMRHGLTSQVKKGKKTYFVAEDPHELENILDYQQQEVEHRRRFLGDSMNQLVAVYNRQKGKPTVRYFEGEDGLEALDRYRSNIEDRDKGSVQYGISPIDLVEQNFPERRQRGVSDRVKAKVTSKVIFTHNQDIFNAKDNKSNYRESLFLPKELLPIDMSLSILPWGVKIYSLDKTNPYGIVIEDEGLAKNMKVIHDLAWKGAETIRKERKIK